MPVSQTNLAGDLLIDLGRAGEGPLHERVKRALRSAIRSGRVEVGTALPPSRQLAGDLGRSRWAVTEAYGQLVAEGYLEARSGSATRVRWSGDRDGGVERPVSRQAPEARFDLAPGLPDLRAFPRSRWADAVRAQVTNTAFTEFGYSPPGGHPRLRELLAEYLGRSRGVSTTAQDVTVCMSVTDGVRRVCRALRSQGITAVGCEEPGWTRLRQVIRAAGLDPVPVRTDGGGLRVDDLAGHSGLRAVLAAPAHQFPLGTVLVPERRAALLDWARRVDGVVLEDDYDAEFRYDRRPVAALQGMDPSRVVLLKSLSKTLSPALGIGWLVAPSRWTDVLHRIDQTATHPRSSTSSRSPPCWSRAATTVTCGPADSATASGATRSCGSSPNSCPTPRCPASRPGSISSSGCRPPWTPRPWSGRRPPGRWPSPTSPPITPPRTMSATAWSSATATSPTAWWSRRCSTSVRRSRRAGNSVAGAGAARYRPGVHQPAPAPVPLS